MDKSPVNDGVGELPHLLTQRTVVINVQHMDIHHNHSVKLPVGGRDFEAVSIFDFSVQTLFHDQAPLPIILLDDGELAQRVTICMRDEEFPNES